MKAILTNTRTIKDGDSEVQLTEFQLGRYEIEETVETYTDGSEDVDFDIRQDWREKYLPEIYYEKRFGAKIGKFEIMTTSWGSLPPEEIEIVIAGYREAQEAVAALEKLRDAACAGIK